MKQKEITITVAYNEEDERDYFRLEFDGRTLAFYDGELEDNNLRRNFNDIYSFPVLLFEIVKAVKEGHEITLENYVVNWDEI